MIVAVTGASAGIGRATALEFAKRGWDVAILARNLPRLETVAEEIRKNGVRALPVVVDVSDFAAVEAAANRIEQELGPIEVWVNNAMATVFAPVSELSPQEIRHGTEVTYLGQVPVADAAAQSWNDHQCRLGIGVSGHSIAVGLLRCKIRGAWLH